MNLILSIIYLLITFTITILVFKYTGKYGLFIWMMLSVVICNIQTLKISEILGLVTSLGNISYGAIFLCSDLLSEYYGERECRKGIIISFLGMIAFTILMTIFIKYIPSASDTSQEALTAIFSYMPRITIASLSAYLISQFMDAKIYTIMKEKTNKVYISNNVSTFVSQIFDTIIFVSISFAGVMNTNEILELIVTMLVIKWIIGLLDTPFMLISKKLKVKEL